MYIVACLSTTCSIIFRKINICSTLPLPLLKPACLPLNLLLTPSLVLSMSNLRTSLLGTDVKVIPLQFPHSVRSPFFGILTISPCFHVFGTFSCSQNVLNDFTSHFSVVFMSAFNNSAVISSLPPAFQFGIFLSAVLISAFVIGSVLISFMIGSISTYVTGSSGIGLLRISSKCSFHRSLLANPSVILLNNQMMFQRQTLDNDNFRYLIRRRQIALLSGNQPLYRHCISKLIVTESPCNESITNEKSNHSRTNIRNDGGIA